MAAKIVRPAAFGAGPEPESPLFDEVSTLSEHELALTIGAVKRPSLPLRAIHPVLRQFPRAHTDEAMERLREDLRRNGQRKAIAMYQGYVWDGVARYNACINLGLVPKVWILRGKPQIYLIHRHDPVRYGEPNSPERHKAIEILNGIYAKDWKADYKRMRGEWMSYARDEFRQLYKVSKPCEVCKLDRAYSHAHHLLPLSVQYALGVETPVQDYTWLCHVHHKLVHRLFSAYLTPTRRNEDFPDFIGSVVSERDHTASIRGIFERGYDLFRQVGGVASRGNWRMLSP